MGFFFWVLGLTAQGPWRFSFQGQGEATGSQEEVASLLVKRAMVLVKSKNEKTRSQQKIKKTKNQKNKKTKNQKIKKTKNQKNKKTKNQKNKKTKVLFSSLQIKWSVCHVPLGAPYMCFFPTCMTYLGQSFLIFRFTGI